MQGGSKRTETNKDTKTNRTEYSYILSFSFLLVFAVLAWDLLPTFGSNKDNANLSRNRRIKPLRTRKSNFDRESSSLSSSSSSFSSRDKNSTSATTVVNVEQPLGYSGDDISPACRPRRTRSEGIPIRRLYFAHTRKAGGSTLRKFLRAVAQRHGWTWDVTEGKPAEDPTTCRRNDTLYVTHLRQPVARILSSYKYEGRWKCKQLVQNRTFVPTANNSVTLEEYVADNDASEIRTTRQCDEKRHDDFLWQCSENCYVRWFGKDFDCMVDPYKNYQTAREKLMSYHVIIVTEKMKDPLYVKDLTRMFQVPATLFTTQLPKWCSPQSTQWNKVYPAILRNETLERLERMNQLDTRLYHDITTCPNGTIFPSFDQINGGSR